MEKLKRNSFCFLKNVFSKILILIFLFSAIFNGGFFIASTNSVFALSENITQINFTSLPQTIEPDILSDIMTVQTQNIDGDSEKVSEKTYLIFSSTSPTGKFYDANASSCTDELEEPFTLILKSNSANKNFCYQDQNLGTHTITVEAQGKSWTSAAQNIVIIGEEEEPEYNVDFTEITEDINKDTIWTKEESPYLVYNSILINEGVTLTIEPGVVVKFNPENKSALYVLGDIIANGSKDNPIYFTSNYDDLGGSTDDDYVFCDYIDFDDEGNPIGNEVCEIMDWIDPEVGDWGGMFFRNSNSSDFKNIFISYIDDAFYLESSTLNFENLNIKNGDSGIIGSLDSTVNIIGGQFNNLKDAFIFYDNSSLSVKNVSISDVINGFTSYLSSYYKDTHPGIDFFNNSNLTIADSDLECSGEGITVFNNYNLDINNSNISCLGNGISLFNRVNANINKTKISKSESGGVVVFNNTDQEIISINNSEITENIYGIMVFDSDIKVNKNSIYNNSTYGALTFSTIKNPIPTDLDFTNNWWGDKTGPTHSLNPSGLGDTISDNILFSPWLTYDPLLPRKDPVILIPGITGTYLYKNYDDYGEIWPNVLFTIIDITDLSLKKISLMYDGSEYFDKKLNAGDIIRAIPEIGIHVFDRLINGLQNNGYVEGENLFVFPYDWRKSSNETSRLLKEKIDQIILDSGYSQVDIVAHSMGGLIAKKYIFDNGYEKVDQLIFLGTPQLGASKAFKALMFGDNMGFEKFGLPFLTQSIAKEISQNMPSVYELLPSEKYIEQSSGYIIDAQNSNPVYLNYEETKDLMIEKGRNPFMFEFAESLHSDIDNLDLSPLEAHNFVGCGTKTIGEIIFQKKRSWKKLFLGWEDGYDLIYVNGDETVPLNSAKETIGANVYFAKNNTHGSLPSADGVRQNIVSILTGQGVQDFENILTDTTTCNISGRIISVHSPVNLHIYDEDGNHTGSDENGEIEYGIENIQYDVLEDEKFAFLPDGFNYKIVTKATDTGGYNFQIIDQDENDEITSRYDWTLVPLKSLNSQGEIWIGPDYDKDEYILSMDDDGDGIFDNEYESGFDGTSYAEKITKTKDIETKRYSSSGSLVTNYQKGIELVTLAEEVARVDSLVRLEINKEKENIDYEKLGKSSSLSTKEIEPKANDFEELSEDKNNLLASAHASRVNPGIIWATTALFILLLIVLVKKLTTL